MPIRLPRLSTLVLLALVSCRSVPLTPAGVPMAEIEGYRTDCEGSLRIVLADGSKVSRSYSPAGTISLEIEADSEPGYQDGFSGDPAYMCSHKSRHELSFAARPGHSYRLKLGEDSPPHYTIEVREAPDPHTVEQSLIPSESSQLSIEKLCGFYGLRPNCNNALLDF